MATWRLIDTGGIAGATTREIAREAGYSNGVLSHYFENRQEILAQAMLTSHRAVRARADAQIKDMVGLEALRVIMLESLPLDAQRRLEARIEACFWGAAVGDEQLMKLQRTEVDGWCARVRTRLIEAADDGQLARGVAVDEVVEELLALMDSFSIQSVLSPERIPPDRQVEHLDRMFAAIGSKPTRPRDGARNRKAAAPASSAKTTATKRASTKAAGTRARSAKVAE